MQTYLRCSICISAAIESKIGLRTRDETSNDMIAVQNLARKTVTRTNNHIQAPYPDAGKISSARVPAGRFFDATNLMATSGFVLYLNATSSTRAGDAVAYLHTRAMTGGGTVHRGSTTTAACAASQLCARVALRTLCVVHTRVHSVSYYDCAPLRSRPPEVV